LSIFTKEMSDLLDSYGAGIDVQEEDFLEVIQTKN